MSRSFIKHLVFLLLLIGGTLSMASAQSKQSLQAKKKKLQKEIQFTNKLLKETSKSKSTSIRQLRQLNAKISRRQRLIETMEEEIQLLNDSIQLQMNKVDSLQKNLEQLKEEYAEMIRNAYQNRSAYNRLMFIFSADNFNQAFKRMKYFQQYARYRQEQAAKIEAEQEEIDAQIIVLEAIKKSNEGLLKAQLGERNVLAGEQNQQQKMVNSLKGKEKQLKADLNKKKKESQRIAKEIERIIAEEIRKAREAARKAGKNTKGFPMTPEARELSNSFAANKGKLPWPVLEGVITSHFGLNRHPSLRIDVNNNGIDISTKKESIARAAFNGKVSRIILVPGKGKAILINHGEYFTLYGFFKQTIVSAGDEVTTKQNLGVLIDESDEGSTIMHFEIWKGMTKLDPEKWIYKN